jgi:MoaA/NifB/PqqE/SkfB family radical SAM enzyme
MDDIDQFRKEIIDSETFCFNPFIELSTTPSGQIKPCCHFLGSLEHEKGSPVSIYRGDTFESIWNSDAMISVRRGLHQGDVPTGCRRCVRDGEVSMRKRSIKDYKDDREILKLVKETIENDYHANHSLIMLELKPSNLCNLKCMICNAYDSSQIAKEIKEISKKYSGVEIQSGRVVDIVTGNLGIIERDIALNDIDINNVEWADNDQIWKDFEKLAPHLHILSFAGGEPTLMPSVLKVLNYCVENDFAKNIKVFISSNFTNLNKNFFDLMPKFKNFEIIASIDGFGLVQEYVRFPSDWNQISKNYITAKEYMKFSNVRITINITVHLLNVLNLVDLLDWIEERALEYPYYRAWPYNINVLISPDNQTVNLLPDNSKSTAIDRLERYIGSSRILKEFPGLDSKIKFLINELRKPGNIGKLESFKKRLYILDRHRNISFKDFIPEVDL